MVIFRLGAVSDLGALVELEGLCFGPGALSPISLRQYLDLSGPGFWVAVRAETGAVCGYAVGGACLGNPTEGWLLSVAVAPTVRGQGVGQRLVRAVLDTLRTCGVLSVRATVSPHNLSSRRLLSTAGFQEERQEEDYFGPGEPRLLVCHRPG